MNIPFVDLNRQYKSIKDELDKEIFRVTETGQFILGEDVESFEKDFAKFVGAKYSVGLDSGTSALELSLRALGIGPGDEVITVANTFIATASSIAFVGAKPVLVDINPETYNIDPDKIKEKITKKTKAIIPVHLYGQPCEIDEIMDIAKKNSLYVIEDACQSHGAEYKNKKTGSIGDISAFSFYPAKNLGCFGDGGAIATNNEEIAEKIKMLRNYGQKQKYHHEFIAYNRRLDNLQAAILRVKLKYLEKWNEMRIKNARRYDQLFQDIGQIITPKAIKNSKHVYHLYVVRCQERDKLQQFLKENGISTGIHYPIPIHMQPAFKNLGLNQGAFPITEKFCGEILSLPMFPELREDEIEYTVEKIEEFYSRNI